MYRVDRRALAVGLVCLALFLYAALVAGKGDPLAPPRPSTLRPAPDVPAAPAAGGPRPRQPARARPELS